MPQPPDDLQKTMVGAPSQPEPAAPERRDPLVGQELAGRYRILRRLGEGGMGIVYLGEHVMLEKKVAIKLLSEDMSRKQDLVQRFMQEAKAASRVGQENIIDVNDVGQTPEGIVFFVMEYLDGQDLAGLLRKEGALPWPRIQAIAAQICRALSAAHAKGIIHRDLKPENVFLVDREGRRDFVKVLDFGIAKMSGSDGGEAARLTRTGMIFGTPEYMSPEQARGEKVDHRVDVYAMGVILYEMICGEVPFKADSFMGVLTKHMMDAPRPLPERRPDLGVPDAVEQFVMRALSKDREQRFQTMEELGNAIAQTNWGGGGPKGDIRVAVESKPSTGEATHGEARAQKRGAPLGKRIIIAGGVALALGCAVLLLSGRENLPGRAAPPTTDTTSAPAAAAPPVPSVVGTVSIKFETTPSAADVLWDGQARGRTPISLSVPISNAPTTAILRKAEHEDHTIEFVASEPRSFVVSLVPLAAPKPASRPTQTTAARPARRPASPSARPTVSPPSPAPATASPPATTSPPPKPKPAEGLKDPFAQ